MPSSQVAIAAVNHASGAPLDLPDTDNPRNILENLVKPCETLLKSCSHPSKLLDDPNRISEPLVNPNEILVKSRCLIQLGLKASLKAKS